MSECSHLRVSSLSIRVRSADRECLSVPGSRCMSLLLRLICELLADVSVSTIILLYVLAFDKSEYS
jgi:hypothetical protein